MSTVETTAGFEPLTDRQEHTVYAPTTPWSDDFALKVAVQDFERAEQYRTQNHDWRWRTADEIYTAWVVQKYWEGTRIPRASIPIYLAFEQIEAMLPKLLGAIFAEEPWFQSDPVGVTTAEQGRQWRDLLSDQLDKTRVREIFRRAIKSAMVYGNGIMKLSWECREVTRAEWRPRFQPKLGIMGVSGYDRVLDKRNVTRIENKPQLEFVSLKDFYVDPNCSSPQPQDGRYYCIRKLVTVDDIDQLRGLKEFNIPSKDTLIQLAINKPVAQADATKNAVEMFRMGMWQSSTDQTVDPGGQRIECIEYCTADRLVYVLNRRLPILNVPNSYGFMPVYDAFYADVLDRFYAMGVCDVLEGEQRLQVSLANGRLDELAMSLHRPLIKKKGVNTPASMLRVRPGQVWEAEDPSKDYQFLKTEGITANAYIEQQASDMRAQKTTGVSDLSVLGVGSSGGNSASRTATGVGVQAQASASRLQYIVENLEDTFIEPMLNDLVKLNQMFPPIGTQDAEAIALSKVAITMRASAKMQSRMSLLQTFPLIFQALTNPGFVTELATQGVTPDWEELMHVLTDMTGYRNRADLIRKLTPQEMQMRQEQAQQQEKMSMQKQRERIQGQQMIQREKLQAQAQENAADRQELDEQDTLYSLTDVLKALIPTTKEEKEPKKK